MSNISTKIIDFSNDFLTNLMTVTIVPLAGARLFCSMPIQIKVNQFALMLIILKVLVRVVEIRSNKIEND